MAQRLAAILLFVAPSIALAQTITVTESNDQDKAINVAECNAAVSDQLSFTWTVTTSGSLDLFASDTAGCPIPTANANTNAKTITIQGSIQSTTTSLTNVITVPSLLSQLSISCPGPKTQVSFCLFPAGTNTGGTTTSASATGAITLDLQTPPAPNLTALTPGDTALNVTWSTGSGTADGGSGAPNSFRVYCDQSANVPDGGAVTPKCVEVTGQGTTSTRISGLTNNTEYTVEVTAVTVGGNESPRSNPLTATPLEIQDFWRLYKADGGQERGGCAVGAGGLLALLALAPIAWYRRRRRP